MAIYRSCHWIEGGLLVADQIKVCCVGNLMNHATDAVRTLGSLRDGRLALDRVFAVKEQLRVANQTPQAPCQGCHLLQEQSWTAHRGGFDFVAFGGYMHCNLACSFCVSSKHLPGERLPGSLLAVMDQLIEAGALRAPARIDLGGGEPTLYHEFRPMMERCLEHGLSATIFTNATGYVEVLAEGLRRGLFTLITSVDAGTRETYLRLKTKVFFDRVWENLARYAAANPSAVTAKYILVPGNLARDDLAGFVARCRQAGIGRIAIAKNVYSIVDAANTSPQELLDAAVYLAALAQTYGIEWHASTELSGSDRQSIEARLASGSGNLLYYRVPRSNEAYPEFLFTGDPGFARRLEFALASGVRTVTATLYYPATLDELPGQVILWLRSIRQSRGGVHLDWVDGVRRLARTHFPHPEADRALRRFLKRKIAVEPGQAIEILKDFDAVVTIDQNTGRVLSLSFTRRDPARRAESRSWVHRWLERIREAIGGPRSGPQAPPKKSAA